MQRVPSSGLGPGLVGAVHLAMDTATSDIRAVEFTSSSDGDSPVLPDLLGQIPEGEDLGTVTADGAYDTHRCHTRHHRSGGHSDHPDPGNGRPWKEDCPAAIAETKLCAPLATTAGRSGNDGRDTTSEAGSEAKMRCLKAFGERIAARDPDRQTAKSRSASH